MSSRALRRLQAGGAVIKVSAGKEESSGEEDNPGFCRKKPGAVNPFAALLDEEQHSDDRSRDGDAEEENDSTSIPTSSNLVPPPHAVGKRKKKKRKKSKQHQSLEEENSEQDRGVEEVDAAVKEVNELLGEMPSGGKVPEATVLHKPLLSVERRFLSAENEMRKIFGSRVVRGEVGRQRVHRRRQRHAMFAAPKDTWPRMDKSGLIMEMGESKDGYQYFVFKHSPDYQKVQLQFYDCVMSNHPEAIAHLLQSHPYHIDSLLQLSEVCKMSEDMQMATELLERALYCFECSFHTLFNVAHGNCRLNYSIAENRPFFIALFRHLFFTGRKGCHRTALEYCKLLLSLDPEGDPLGVLLMIDYYALRADEYGYLLMLFKEWEAKRNLSQLPNFALSVPLALFHSSRNTGSAPSTPSDTDESAAQLEESNNRLQEALLTFPSILLPLMEKCQVTLDPAIMNCSLFNHYMLERDPSSLRLLFKLFIERNFSLWKVPEVLTWLEENARKVVARFHHNDPLIAESIANNSRRYIGAPRNIQRHVVMADFDKVRPDMAGGESEPVIMMYDPLPPSDSVSSYPPVSRRPLEYDHANPVMLFLRSFLPSFNVDQLAAQLPERGGGGGGAEGHGNGTELNQLRHLQDQLNAVVGMLQRMLERSEDQRASDDGYDSTSTSDDGELT